MNQIIVDIVGSLIRKVNRHNIYIIIPFRGKSLMYEKGEGNKIRLGQFPMFNTY